MRNCIRRSIPKSFGLVKDQSVGSLTGAMTSPDHLTDVALMSALYPPGDPSRRFATPQTVGSLTLDQVKSWYAAAYRPDLTTIVVIGNTTPDEAKAVFEKYFSKFWTAQGPKPNIEPPAVPANTASEVTIPATGRVQSSVQLVETLPLLRTDPDWARLQLANTVLIDRRLLLVDALSRSARSARLRLQRRQLGERRKSARYVHGSLRMRSAEYRSGRRTGRRHFEPTAKRPRSNRIAFCAVKRY